jgi:Tfp pilus assembly protein PilV
LTPVARAAEDRNVDSSRRRGQRGFGFVEVIITLLVVVVAGFLLFRYVGSTASTLDTMQEQRPFAGARLAADQATLNQIQRAIREHQAEHGRWPADKAAVLALFAAPPKLQCSGSDFEYEPSSGAVRLVTADPGRC